MNSNNLNHHHAGLVLATMQSVIAANHNGGFRSSCNPGIEAGLLI